MATIKPALSDGLFPHVLDCPYVSISPLRMSDTGASPGVTFRTWRSVVARVPSWQSLKEGYTWADLLRGHPGHQGGGSISVVGSAMAWGAAIDGAEFWLADAEGLDDSPEWAAALSESALIDGSWLSRVAAKGREITLGGFVAASDMDSLDRAKLRLSSLAAAPPRTAVLFYKGRRISVALNGRIRTRHIGALAIEVEMSFVGVDLGPDAPGGGVFFQGGSQTYRLDSVTDTAAFLAAGSVPTPPRIEIVGPAAEGATVEISDANSRTYFTLARDVAAGHRLDIESRTRSVLAIAPDGTTRPDYSAVTADAWPLAGVDGGSLYYGSLGVSGGSVTVTLTELY